MAQQQNTQSYLKALSILHYALVAGITLFAVIAFALLSMNAFGGDEALRTVFLYIVPIVAFLGVVLGGVLYKKRVNEIKTKSNVSEKLEAHRAAFIVRDALMEGPALFAIIAYLLTGEALFLGLTASIVLLFLLLRPTKDKLVRELDLSSSDEMDI